MPTQHAPKASRRRRSGADPIAPTALEHEKPAPTPEPAHQSETQPQRTSTAEQRDRLRVTVPKPLLTELKRAYVIDAGPGVSWSDWITGLLSTSLDDLHTKYGVEEFTGPGVLSPGRPRSQ
ncbi:hypothetical protein KTU01_34380 [Kocuria turfanensis]|uniref:Uncharacterized protein n=1 Tax=Kocuria turfanensis TaxID=388357 RepID=A0A512IHX9_9MICC|nr:hypothetical protein KTU01_34380 [Kocuria turfanensis]